MKQTHWLRQAVHIIGTLTILLSVLTSSGLPLQSQSPLDAKAQTHQPHLPVSTVASSVTKSSVTKSPDTKSPDTKSPDTKSPDTEQTEVDESQPSQQPNQHRSDDAVDMSLEELKALSDPMAGVLSAELQAAAVPGPPNEVGRWSDVINVGVVPIFVALMPNGKVLMWDTDPNSGNGRNNETRTRLWDPNSGGLTNVDLDGHNVFCAGFTHLSDGRLFVAGGNIDNDQTGIRQTHLFNSANNSWTRGPDMAEARWYPSVAALPNEELFIMGGVRDIGDDLHEVYQTDNSIRGLTSARLAYSQVYPFIQTAPNGRVLHAGPQTTMRSLDTSGGGSWQSHGRRDGTYRGYGSYAMYDVGKLLVTGGTTPATDSATIIDVNGESPSARITSDMIKERRQHNLTVLPDGTVLATGGLYGTAGLVDLDRGVYAAEVWNPDSEAWTELANMEVTRQYHSVALLLADGRVMVGGGGVCGDCSDVGYYRDDIEIFEPPYLFDSSGNLADRPTISSVASEIGVGNNFTINSPDASSIAKIGLVKLGAPTHSQNMGQRYIPLSYSQSGNRLTATAPANTNIAPPGYYMLFIIDNDGVPSVAKFVNISLDAEPEPEPEPVLVRVEQVQVESASTTSVPISLDPSESGLSIGAIELTLTYNQDVFVVTDCTLNGFTGACNIATPGVVAIAGANAEDASVESVLANLTIQAVGAVGTSSDVTMSVSLLSDITGRPIPAFQLENGGVTIIEGEGDPPGPICAGLLQEAEDGALYGDFEIAIDTSASGNNYVYVPEDSVGDRRDAIDENRRVDYCFNVPQAGDYAMKGIIYATDGESNSFYVKVNGAPSVGYIWAIPSELYNQYVLDYVNDRDNATDPVVVTLEAGEQIVSIYLREDGTRLDTIGLEAVETSPTIPGDVDCDDDRDAVDALFTLQYEVGERTDSGSCPLQDSTTQLYAAGGDIDGNGRTNVVDALYILQCAIGVGNGFCGVNAASADQISSLRKSESAVGSVDVIAAQTGQTVRVQLDVTDGNAAVGTFQLRYDSRHARLLNCEIAGQGACHERADGVVHFAFVEPLGLRGSHAIAELTFDDADVALTAVEALTVADSAGRDLTAEVTLSQDMSSQVNESILQLFVPLISQ